MAGTNDPRKCIYFSVQNSHLKVKLHIRNEGKYTFRPYYDRHRNLYDVLNVGNCLVHDETGLAMYSSHLLFLAAERAGLPIEIQIWERSIWDLFFDSFYERECDYVYIAENKEV